MGSSITGQAGRCALISSDSTIPSASLDTLLPALKLWTQVFSLYVNVIDKYFLNL